MISKGLNEDENKGKSMEKSKQENKFSFDTLVLLIGTNPLPNYVVAEFFLKNNTKLKNIFLMHSEKGEFQEGTLEQALNLETVLKKKYDGWVKFPLEKIALSDVSNATKTMNDLIKDFIPSINKLNNVSMHLNYTGGTKVMCVHVYRFIEKEMDRYNKSRISYSFSYFDGRSFRIVDDSSDSYISDDLRKESSLSFENIMEMHGFKRKVNPDHFEIFPDCMKQIKKQIDAGQVEKVKETLESFYNNNIKTIDSKNLNDLKLEKRDKNSLWNILKSMPPEFHLYDEDGCFDSTKIQDGKNERLKKNWGGFKNFFNGIWLENYIYYLLNTELRKSEKISVEWDLRIDKKDWLTFFQIDVIVQKGFQLTGISCTVGKEKGICKQKGFEIIHRTRQIGGDESKAIVVTFLDDRNAEAVQDELQKDSGCREGQVLVFGKKDLKSSYFIQKVKEFIK
jgi:hypothetical protein